MLNRREFLKGAILSGLATAFAPQIAFAEQKKLGITDWVTVEAVVSPCDDEDFRNLYQYPAKLAIDDFLEEHPTCKLVKILEERIISCSYACNRGQLGDVTQLPGSYKIAYGVFDPEHFAILEEDQATFIKDFFAPYAQPEEIPLCEHVTLETLC